MTTSEKLVQMVIAIALFYGVMAVILLLTQRLRSRRGERVQAAAFLGPTLALIAIGLLYPAIVTVWQSLHGSATFNEFLKRQSPEFIERVLGKRRAELFLAGKLTVRDLISGTGRELSLAELTNP